ncbi:MAG: C25 family cysteine peptidase [Rhodothermales bacterium]
MCARLFSSPSPLQLARSIRYLSLFLLACCLYRPLAHAQDTGFDPSWYDPSRTYVKVAVVDDAVYRISGSDLTALGISTSSIQPSTLQLFENGKEIPLWYTGNTSAVDDEAAIYFIGKRNKGTGESWAYQDTPEWQSSTHFSLYTDTTYYWLAWGRSNGLRYRKVTSTPPPYPNVTAFRDTLHIEDDTRYYDGDGNDAENPFYTRGEGFYSNSSLEHSNTDPISRQFRVRLGNLARTTNPEDTVHVQARVNSFTNTRHRVSLEMETVVGGNQAFRTFEEFDWTGYAFQTFNAAIPASEVPTVQSNQLTVQLTSHNEFNAQPNRTYIDWVKLSFVSDLVAQNGALRFSFAENGGRRLTVRGFSGDPVLVFSPVDLRVFDVVPDGGNVVFSDFSTAPPVYWASSQTAVRTPAAFLLDRSSDWANTSNEADYVIVTTRALRASAEALANYRRVRNGYEVEVVDVQDLFDQFDYGRQSPLAIRRFVHQMQRWRTTPEFLVFWGDALYASRTRQRQPWEVPSFGKASSDGWFAMQTNGLTDWTENIAIGRLPVRDDETGLLFLQKMQTYEATPLDDWQKRMLMLVGGRTPGEQSTLQNFVKPWAGIAIAAPTGMDTLNFWRNTSEPIDESFQTDLRVAFREGASWLTYFGHSAAVEWEIITDKPQDYNNADRLPVAISLGCRTGAFAGGRFINENIPVFAEQLLLGSLNGAIAHWGTSGLGSIGASARLGNEVYDLVFSDTLRTIGKVFQETKRRYATSGAFSLRDLVQFGLLGDPATRVNLPTRPEFFLSQEQLHITPEAPVPTDEHVTVSVRLKNRGLVPSDSIRVHLLHTDPLGNETLYAQDVAPFTLEQEISFLIPITEEMVGENRFAAQIDPEDVYREVSETNNAAERTHIVFSKALSLIAPRALGTVPSSPFRLRVTFTADPDGTPVLFELDETPTFDSPNLKTHRTVSFGSFAVWTLEEPLTPGRPYYWRARIETPDGLVNWSESSFFVQEGPEQNTWIQTGSLFDFNTHDQVTREDDRWVLGTFPLEVKIASGGGILGGVMSVGGDPFELGRIGVGVLILDGNSGAVLGHGSFMIFSNRINRDPVQHLAAMEALLATAEEGNYIFIRTRNLFRTGDAEIPEEIKDIFRALGSTAIDDLTYDHLWTMMTRKGHPEETEEQVAPPGSDDIEFVTTVSVQVSEGSTRSPQIGPARSWETLNWEIDLPNETSEVLVDVLAASSDVILMAGLSTPGEVDLSSIDAKLFPFLRLRATLRDTTQRATPQLSRWSMDFTSTPELVLDGSSLTLSADTLQEADNLTASATILNLSDTPAEDVILRLLLTDPANRTSVVGVDTLARIEPDSEATASFELNTDGLIGRNLLTFEAEQPGLTEQITFNNTAITEFHVRGDSDPPELRVSIDGTELPNDPDPVRDLQSLDITQVSVQPTIEIVLSDTNPFKLLTDTSLVTLTLERVDTPGAEERIAFNRPDVQFEPATEERNEARILFTPDFTGLDAVFTLRVEAFDISQNEAVGSPYQVHFRIESTFEIGTVYPYPNPMSTFTRFAFLLKGADPTAIEDFRIRIYTVTGRVVQEFDVMEDPSLLEGGQLRIGWNKLFWDGRDVDGDLLATGVYLYKVFLKVDGETITVNNDSGIEKLVVLR